MKTFILLVALAFSGCSLNPKANRAIDIKTTVLGVDISGSSSPSTPHIRIGLVRTSWREIPTNSFYMTHVSGQIGFTSQRVDEEISTLPVANAPTAPMETSPSRPPPPPIPK